MFNRNFHRAEYLRGRWVYDFPPNWASNNTQNKAIAVRRIETPARSYCFDLVVTVTTNIDGGDLPHNDTYRISCTIPSDYTLEEALSTMIQLLKKVSNLGWSFTYDENNTVNIDCAGGLWYADTGTGIEFWQLMNVSTVNPISRDPTNPNRIIFRNVWNRRVLFIHASFVTSSSQGYLGRGGEFYTQPNKLYYADFPSRQFYLEVSLDGYHPVPLPNENFIVELVFMIDEQDHVGC
jgi:hypothetical protein